MIELEWVTAVIRAGDEHFKGPVAGTKYNFVCTVLKEGDSAFILAACGKFDRRVYKQIKARLAQEGIKTVRYERLNTESERSIEVQI